MLNVECRMQNVELRNALLGFALHSSFLIHNS
jgi:hypothetical protein